MIYRLFAEFGIANERLEIFWNTSISRNQGKDKVLDAINAYLQRDKKLWNGVRGKKLVTVQQCIQMIPNEDFTTPGIAENNVTYLFRPEELEKEGKHVELQTNMIEITISRISILDLETGKEMNGRTWNYDSEDLFN